MPGLRFTFPAGIPELKMPVFLTLCQDSVAALVPVTNTVV